MRRVPSKPRLRKGQISIELAASCIFFLLYTLIAVDCGLVIFGAFLNDRACRDACRAAAQSRTQAEAATRANAVLSTHSTGGGIITNPTMTAITYNDFGGRPPVDESPFVSLTVSSRCNLPFAPLKFLGGEFSSNSVAFVQSYSFPIVRIQ